jgi:DNA-binding XRE family transcriptional regulator
MTSPAQVLRERRVAVGISQHSLAHTLGITPQFLCDIELGRRILRKQYARLLPAAIRKPVIRAMIAEHRAEIADLQRLEYGEAA